MFFKELFHVLDALKKNIKTFLLVLFLCTEQFTDTNLFTFSQDSAAHLL